MRLNVVARIAQRMRNDLLQPPLVGEERLGVALVRYASSYTDLVAVLTDYAPLPSHAYVEQASAPVAFDVRWFMSESQRAAEKNAGLLLVHLHHHTGRPWFSPVDMRTNRNVLLPIGRIDPGVPTGALLLSLDRAAALLVRAGALTSVEVAEVPG